MFTLLDLCVSSLRRGHANLLCIVPILTDDPRRESEIKISTCSKSHGVAARKRKHANAGPQRVADGSGDHIYTECFSNSLYLKTGRRYPFQTWVWNGYLAPNSNGLINNQFAIGCMYPFQIWNGYLAPKTNATINFQSASTKHGALPNTRLATLTSQITDFVFVST